MSSGVAVADECKAIFEEIKKSKKYRYCIFHIKDEKVISVEEKGDRDASYDAFLNDLQKGGDGECRYGLYDFEYEHQCQVFTECHHCNKGNLQQSNDLLLTKRMKNHITGDRKKYSWTVNFVTRAQQSLQRNRSCS